MGCIPPDVVLNYYYLQLHRLVSQKEVSQPRNTCQSGRLHGFERELPGNNAVYGRKAILIAICNALTDADLQRLPP
jgi:hypothetical protein